MLKSLLVKNYALINHLDIQFSPGFSIITGETGAGKSILLGALGLILGQRADTGVLHDKSGKCIVEGVFEISNLDLRSFFEENDIDFEKVTTIRREINESGKSRAFINDTPVTLNQLRDLTVKLVDIHSQHETLLLSDSLFQMNVLDILSGVTPDLQEYIKLYSDFRTTEKKLSQLMEESKQAATELDYFQFQLQQIEEAKLDSGEQEELEEEQKALSHAGEIQHHLALSSGLLSEGDTSILTALKDSLVALQKIQNFYARVEPLAERLNSSLIELKDIAAEVDKLAATVDIDPNRLEVVNERLDLIYSLQQKHKVSSLNELIAIRDDLAAKLAHIYSYDEEIEKSSQLLEKLKQAVTEKSAIISGKRKKIVPVMEARVMEILRNLGIPNAVFRVSVMELSDFTVHGKDKVVYLFSANKQSSPMELSKVASGGELSRVMLSLKSLVSESRLLPTIIFDEIDAGVSGEIADKMGNILRKMSHGIQLVNITHLPQVASKGDTHYLVYKQDNEKATYTHIKQLSSEERVMEIARMLSGEELTDAAIRNARELMSN
jgi:DNA repair protein RecN (Recombination protein N)